MTCILYSEYSYGLETNRARVQDSDSEIEAIDEEQKDAEKKENLRMVRRDWSGLEE